MKYLAIAPFLLIGVFSDCTKDKAVRDNPLDPGGTNPMMFTISGTITGADSVTVTLKGSATDSQVVNDCGKYSFTVRISGSYTVETSKPDHVSIPTGQTFNNIKSDKTQDFFIAQSSYTISGTIKGADGVNVALSGDSSDTTTVNSGENYSFLVDSLGDYTITPTKPWYVFSPRSKTFENVISDCFQDFEAVFTKPLLAFASDLDESDGDWEVYIIDANGENIWNLTNNMAYDNYPCFSPDGTKIAFTFSRGDNMEIYVMDADGSNPRNLTNHSGDDFGPKWSPDGTKIAFGSDRDGNHEIYVMDADGSNQRNLSNHPDGDYTPSWSPDGSQIVFNTDRVGREIFVMDADGSNQRNLTNNSAWDLYPCWSPDGTKIAFMTERNDDYDWDKEEIYIMGADGSNQRNLTTDFANDSMPCWSPDGTKIAFISDRDGKNGIYIMNADGSNQWCLTKSTHLYWYLSWYPF